MTTISGSLYVGSTSSLTHQFTVPTGVTPAMTGVFAFGTSDNLMTAGTAFSSTGATFTQYDERAALTSVMGVWTGTGLTAGNTVTVTLQSSEQVSLLHFYTDEFTVDASPFAAAVRGASSASTTSGSITPDAGDTVLVIGLDRAPATVSPTPTVTSSGGETVTTINYDDTALNVQPGASVYFGKFTASASAARTVTVTYNVAANSGYAALVTTTSTVPGPGQNQFPSAVTAGSWTNVGGAASAVAALSDALTTTYMQSPTPPSSGTPLLMTMGPIGAGGITFYVEGATGGGTATRTVTVYKADGTTQIYTTSYAITTTTAEQAVTLDSAALAAIPTLPDRTALVVQIVDVPA